VRLTETSGRTVAQVATDPGVGKSTLTRLRLENKILRQERDLLKNAAAFFAEETSR
jgi:transposase